MEEEKKKLLNTASFTINLTVKSGKEYSGTFTVHRPTVGELMRMGVQEARELGGMSNIDLQTSALARMLSTLDVVIDLKPEWWKPREIYDTEVIQEVYEKYVDYLNQFLGEFKSKTTG